MLGHDEGAAVKKPRMKFGPERKLVPINSVPYADLVECRCGAVVMYGEIDEHLEICQEKEASDEVPGLQEV